MPAVPWFVEGHEESSQSVHRGTALLAHLQRHTTGRGGFQPFVLRAQPLELSLQIRIVKAFRRRSGGRLDRAGPDDLRPYQVYLLEERKVAVGIVVAEIAALRFFFLQVMKRRDMKRTCRIRSAEGRTMLLTLYGVGLPERAPSAEGQPHRQPAHGAARRTRERGRRSRRAAPHDDALGHGMDSSRTPAGSPDTG